MTKKKVKKGKAAAKKMAKRKTASKGKDAKPELNPLAVRKDISKMVEEQAEKIAQAVIGECVKGQLAPVKYLFEMANIFPPSTDGSQASADEESLAGTLLDRLGIPRHPVVADEYEKGESGVILAKKVEVEAGKPEKENVDSEKTPEESAEVPVACE
jgi:hypothetical protein